MRIHTIIHASFEKPGIITNWITDKGYQHTSTHTYLGQELPDPHSVDFLIIMGGPQSPTQLDKYPYLREEILFTRKIIDQQKSVLGICLGAQIISESLGAATNPSEYKEVGAFPIHLTDAAMVDPIFKHFPKTFEVMHWHNDMPGIPKDAVLLAHSEGCSRQALRYKENVYGLQCHLEMTAECLKGMIENCTEDLRKGPYIQNQQQLLSLNLSEIQAKMQVILAYLSR